MKKTYEDFKKLQELLEIKGYEMHYNTCYGDYVFENEDDMIVVHDYYDWDKNYKELKERI